MSYCTGKLFCLLVQVNFSVLLVQVKLFVLWNLFCLLDQVNLFCPLVQKMFFVLWDRKCSWPFLLSVVLVFKAMNKSKSKSTLLQERWEDADIQF